MTVHCFTSITFNYLARARVLGHSIRRFHPDWKLWLCVSDREPHGYSLNICDEPFDEIIWADALDVPDVNGWLFGHDLVELCTAVKGPVLRQLLEDGAEKVIYLDPDIALFNSLDCLVDLLDEYNVLLTPHLLEPDDSLTAINDNEVCSLSTGVFNLGFLGVANTGPGRAFANWWSSRLVSFCYDERQRGLFVDQKWCDLAPIFFDGVHIVRDPGCNVASWNLSRRRVDISREGEILVNGVPLRFFHFTKLGPVADAMTQRYAGDNIEVYEIWSWYRRMIERYREAEIPPQWWYFGRFANGALIPKRARELYRTRSDLQRAFPDPFDTGYYDWLQREGWF
jgi:hypothetical protein